MFGFVVANPEKLNEEQRETVRQLKAEGVTRLCTHLTLTADRRKAFLDCTAGKGRWVQGMLDLETGAW